MVPCFLVLCEWLIGWSLGHLDFHGTVCQVYLWWHYSVHVSCLSGPTCHTWLSVLCVVISGRGLGDLSG